LGLLFFSGGMSSCSPFLLFVIAAEMVGAGIGGDDNGGGDSE